jgi:hypothetical protein
MVIFDHVVLLMIQILEEFLRVLMIVIQFYVRDHEFFPKNDKRTRIVVMKWKEKWILQVNERFLDFLVLLNHASERNSYVIKKEFLMKLTLWNCSKSSCFLFNSNLLTSFSKFNCFCKSLASRKDFITDSNSWILFNNCSFSRRFISHSSNLATAFVRYRSYSSPSYSIEKKNELIYGMIFIIYLNIY